MMYPYITLADETEITHSHIIEKDNIQQIEVHFERPKGYGFGVARCILPEYKWIKIEGYTEFMLARRTQSQFYKDLVDCFRWLYSS